MRARAPADSGGVVACEGRRQREFLTSPGLSNNNKHDNNTITTTTTNNNNDDTNNNRNQ